MVQSAVGLMLLASVGALIGLVLWLSNVGFGGRSFRATFIFPNAGGMNAGTPVSYRGVRVGQVVNIQPEPEGVAIEVSISPANLLIPSNSLVEALQSGLVGETTIDITPLQSLPPEGIQHKPLDKKCDPAIIICNGSRIQGQGRLDVNTLIRSLLKISNIISDPEVTAAVQSLFQRSSLALDNLSQLSGDANTLLREAQQTGSIRRLNSTLDNISQLTDKAVQENSIGNLNNTLRSIDQTAGDLSALSRKTTGVIGNLQNSGAINRVDSTLTTVEDAARQIDQFFAVNQSRLTITVDSIRETSDQLRTTVARLDPVLSEVEQSKIIGNLETMSNNAVVLTDDLKNFSRQLNDPSTVIMLQQILDSARSVFDNLQKVTSDVDQITGDPQLRQDLINLIRGLNNLVSSTQHLQEQVYYAQVLDTFSVSLAQKKEALSPNSPLLSPKVLPQKTNPNLLNNP
jgi:phospholipid/cholesterol/gamma-HCH transport system substrate-binding protein